MKINRLVFYIILGINTMIVCAQKTKILDADKQYDKAAYIDAIAIYEQVAEKGYKDEKMFQRLGNAYYFNADLIHAAKWYKQLFDLNQNQESEYLYRYSQTLKSIGDYDKSDKVLAVFRQKAINEQRAKWSDLKRNYLQEIKANSGRYEIENAVINSKFSDYGSAFYNNKLVFASARDTARTASELYKWNNQSYTNLYSSEITLEGTLSEPKRFSKSINSKFHESTPIFTKDGRTMYFTRNNYLNGKIGKNSEKITLLKLYRASFEDGKWVNTIELPFNSDQYSVAHPALSKDEKTLYFASNMPGTIGQSDLYRVQINSDGSYGFPENLGQVINTEGRETFPFISDDGELYFATDGRPGLGGLDIFVAKIEKDNTFAEVQNVGAPVNGGQDDFGLIIDSNKRKGFFTSNREGGKGYDDLYKFIETKRLSCDQILTSSVVDKETSMAISQSKLSLLDEKYELIGHYLSEDNGRYKFDVICGRTYHLRGEKEGYETTEGTVYVPKKSGESELILSLTRRMIPIKVGMDLALTLNIPVIYFDLNKSIIREDAAFQLEKIALVMRQYPAIKIDIRSHTDSRQSAKNNLILSENRAKSTLDWLVKNGIEQNRLTSKGFGESQLINGCSDNVKCSEEEHQANRRSEFIITSI
ncbi:OmpA family protein [Flavobacterium sandaracinum]|uniref:Flagellar motor protein MotB n=1 Tax=Flavobacterium sandaracinum TaxID=2541733 RepID=A0A4R5CWJ1_9FLAO|nr:OmpA family protein [Flavobacterium sandaracinum]TDE05139.1 flagellar motor protein MotB [Flavobacterium sandaracinum]